MLERSFFFCRFIDEPEPTRNPSPGSLESPTMSMSGPQKLAPMRLTDLAAGLRRRSMGHRAAKLIAWTVLVLCASLVLLLDQLNRLHWTGLCSTDAASPHCQHRQRNLMMTGDAEEAPPPAAAAAATAAAAAAAAALAVQPPPASAAANVTATPVESDDLRQRLPSLLIIGVRKGSLLLLLCHYLDQVETFCTMKC